MLLVEREEKTIQLFLRRLTTLLWRLRIVVKPSTSPFFSFELPKASYQSNRTLLTTPFDPNIYSIFVFFGGGLESLPREIVSLSLPSQDGYLKIWDVRCSKEVARFNSHYGAVRDIQFSPLQEFQ